MLGRCEPWPQRVRSEECNRRFCERLVQQLLEQFLRDEVGDRPWVLHVNQASPNEAWVCQTACEASNRIPTWCESVGITPPDHEIRGIYCRRLLNDALRIPGLSDTPRLPRNVSHLFSYARAIERRRPRRMRRGAISRDTE